MEKTDFRIMSGGLSAPLTDMQKQFSSAYVTNTRLMGVLAVYACWDISLKQGECNEPGLHCDASGATTSSRRKPHNDSSATTTSSNRKVHDGSSATTTSSSGNGTPTQLHQFFYIDCEEAGLETFKSFRGEFDSEVRLAEQSLIGGLGAEKIPLTEMELRWLLLHWKKFNDKHGLPLPAKHEEYSFIFDQDFILKKSAADDIMLKTFVDISTDYQLVNYFLMRCFGRDYEAARYLTATGGRDVMSRGRSASGRAANSEGKTAGSRGRVAAGSAGISRNKTTRGDSGIKAVPLDDDFPLDIYDSYIKATFCKNIIDFEREYGDGSVSYICDSLIEMQGTYDTVISRVVVNNCKVIGFEHCDSYSVSAAEAAMMLKKSEFVNVHEVMLDDKRLEENVGEFIVGLNTIMTRHSNGRMFMAFKSTNDHVNERIFMLSNDVRGVYYLTDFGQLIVMSYSQEDLNRLEMKLARSPLGGYLIPTARYEFIEPVLFEFTKSGFEDFEDFLGIGED